MVIEEKLKLNKFQQVSIPRPSDMFARMGFRAMPESAYTGDEILPNGNKVETLGEQVDMYNKYAAEKAAEEAEKTPAE